jgi:hypothetical protein
MRTFNAAVDDIHAIRAQIARATEFRGYGPGSVAATGVLAFLVAAGQSHWVTGGNPRTFLLVWTATAAVCLTLTTLEMVARARKFHAGLAGVMIARAVEQLAPTLMAGLLLTLVFLRFAQTDLWMLPGLWQIMFGLGAFAARCFLPWPIAFVGAWYLATGVVCIAFASVDGIASPWAMGIPFTLGQWFVAAVLRYHEIR